MNQLFQETPLIVQWLPDLPPSTVLLLNRLGQSILIIFGIQSFYESQMYPVFLKPLHFLRKLDKYVYVIFTRTGFAVGICNRGSPIPHEKNLGFPALLILSGIVIILTFFISDHSPIYWFAYPFLQLWKAFTTWGGIRWDILAIIWTPVKSLLLFIWAIMSFTLISTAIIIPTKTLLVIVGFLEDQFSPFVYKAVLVLAFITGAGFVLVTT